MVKCAEQIASNQAKWSISEVSRQLEAAFDDRQTDRQTISEFDE